MLHLKPSFGTSDVLLRLFVGPLLIGWEHMHVYDRQLQRFCSQTLAPKQRWKQLNGKLTIFWVLIWPDHIWTLVQVANMSLVCVWPLTTPPQPDSYPIYNWLLSKCFAWLERMGTVSELRLYKSLLSFHYLPTSCLHNLFFCVCNFTGAFVWIISFSLFLDLW